MQLTILPIASASVSGRGMPHPLQQLLDQDTAFEATLVEHTRDELKTLAANWPAHTTSMSSRR
ncbi:MAG: hypothetical protein ABIR94_21975 [Rubrivivax sp.]